MRRCLTCLAVLALVTSVASVAAADPVRREVHPEALAALRGAKVVVLATNNAGKVRELGALMVGSGFEVISLGEAARRAGVSLRDVDEVGATFGENARLKAQAYADLVKLPTIADDSGISVPALGGFPGVKTRRWADEAAGREVDDPTRNAMLLGKANGLKGKQRAVRWHTAIALAIPGEPRLASTWEASLKGKLPRQARGTRGFGFDPIFLYGRRSLAQMAETTKVKLGPRGQAIRGLVKDLSRR